MHRLLACARDTPRSLSWNMYRAQPAEGLAYMYSMAAYCVNDSVSAMIRIWRLGARADAQVVAQHISGGSTNSYLP